MSWIRAHGDRRPRHLVAVMVIGIGSWLAIFVIQPRTCGMDEDACWSAATCRSTWWGRAPSSSRS
jgi:hypothetical protein